MDERKAERTPERVIDELRAELKQSQGRCKQLEAQVTNLDETIGQLEGDLRHSQAEVKRLTDHSNTMRQTVTGLEKELKDLKSSTDAQHLQVALQHGIEANEKAEKLQDEVDELKKQLKDGKKLVSDVQLERIKELESDVKKLQQRLASRSTEVTERDREINRLKGRLDTEIKQGYKQQETIDRLQHRKAEVIPVEPVPAGVPQA